MKRLPCRYVCDERWYNITRSMRLKGGLQLESVKQPTWCTLTPSQFLTVIQQASSKFPENILFSYTSEINSTNETALAAMGEA